MVTMELSKVTSKTSSIKALLLKAWRERWTDLQWGIHIKTILPRGVSGDVYNLADCILQQALIGPGPNHLVLSYLKHSLSSQLISHAALLQHISKYNNFHKPHCIISLLELLEASQVGITCRGKTEEGILATSVASTIFWLLQCYSYHLNKLLGGMAPPCEEIVSKCVVLLINMLSSDFIMAMLYLAKYEDPELHSEVVKKCKEIEQFLIQNPSLKPSSSIDTCLQKLHTIELNIKIKCEPVTYCLQPLLAIEVMLTPGCETNYLVNKLIMLQKLKGYSNSRLYCDIMRACLISLNSVLGTSEESQWGAFTILKLPHIFKQLHSNLRDESSQSFEFSQDIVDSFDLLLQLTPLLDIMDSKCNCNFVECILNELLKVNLISSKHVTYINEKRESLTNWVQKNQDCNISQQPLPKVIIRAEPTLARLLRTLEADNIKMEGVQTVLCPILGKSFDLITAVAAVEGKLRTFVTKLIKFNETYKYGHGESPKQSQTRALLFDVSFLMLCSIVNIYGSQVVLSEEGGDSFFELWVRESMVEKGHSKSPESIIGLADNSKVEALLAQFNSNEDFKTSQVKWNEICLNVPAAIREVLLAWEQGTLSANDVKRILDSMRSKWCCLPICATAWLCSYMQILHQDALLKPMNMVQQFLAAPSTDDQNETFKSERFSLMSMIIRRMQYNIHPSSSSKISLQHGIISNTPISTQLEKVWSKIHKQGWVSIEATHQFQSLLNTGGPCWFITNVLKQVMQYKYQEDLNRAVDLAFALFHLDILNCTLSLLTEVLPQYLHNKLQCEELVEPQLSALAKICVYCIIAAAQSVSKDQSSKKRLRKEVDSEDSDSYFPATKHMKMNNGQASVGFTTTKTGTSFSPTRQPVMVPALQTACNELFNAFLMISNRGGEISQQTHFVYKFLDIMVKCGRDKTRLVLQGQPLHNLMPNLIRWLPDMVSVELIIGLYDVTTTVGRRAAARDLCMLTNLQAK
ncbi:hypothetical protein RUM43_014247 [Polyplax serrata]|uniref:Mediator of RNA polymerase II transcription subunit 24 n=1 Tax=Polyplax serrata TaxID=468196 RepID=A0AAN8NZU9_POLSC